MNIHISPTDSTHNIQYSSGQVSLSGTEYSVHIIINLLDLSESWICWKVRLSESQTSQIVRLPDMSDNWTVGLG